MITREEHQHIGNIALVNIQRIHRCAEVAILIGETQYWNGGYGRESIYLVTKHAFLNMNLHRVFGGTFNPAFGKCVEKLGWRLEGELRDRIWSNGQYHHQTWYGLLKREFEMMSEFELDDVSLI